MGERQRGTERISCDPLLGLIKDLGDNVTAVEIGVRWGEGMHHMLRSCPNITKAYGIDPWGPVRKVDQEKADKFMLSAIETLRPYINEQRLEIIMGYSFNVVDLFKEGSLDYVFIDGDHNHPAIDVDVKEWYKRVRSGGIIGGHDYCKDEPTVEEGVQGFFGDREEEVVILERSVWYVRKL